MAIYPSKIKDYIVTFLFEYLFYCYIKITFKLFTLQVDGWTSAFLFSLETQQTIGYGSRSIATKCAEAIIVLQIQTIVGIVVDAFMLGLTFAKLSRPRERALTCSFSKNAVITLRNGKMCLMFRVADIRKSQIVEAHIRLQLFREVETAEGHNYPFYQEDLKVCYNPDDYKQQNEDNRNHIFLLFPLVIVHVIDEASPFYQLTPEILKESHFELVAVLDGIVEATGMNTQPKTSYLPDEILWGYNFVNLTDRSCNDERSLYWWDYSRLDDVYKVAVTPLCSPKEYYRQHGFPSENESSMNYL